MSGESRYRPVDPAAYGGRPRLRGVLQARSAPFVVDAPGVWVGDDGVEENEERLVHWETIAEIVFFRAASPGSDLPHDAVGLRLRRHPDVVAIRRVLDSWSLDRTRVEAAVARFAPGVRVVDGPPDLLPPASAARLVRGLVDDAVRFAGQASERQASGAEPAFTPPWAEGETGVFTLFSGHRIRYRAADPDAYVVRPTWRRTSARTLLLLAAGLVAGAVVGRFAGPVVGAFVGVPLAVPFLVHAVGVVRRSVRFAVDAPGVFFGAAHGDEGPSGHRLVPWAEITSVVIFDVELEKSWERAVGVTQVPPGGGEPELGYHRVLTGWGLDRAAIEAAVRRFAPHVPVVDGPPLARPRLLDLAGAALGEWRRRRRR